MLTTPGRAPPEKRSPAASGKANRAGHSKKFQATVFYHDPEAVAKVHPEAHRLSVYDGSQRIEHIVDVGWPKPAWAFDANDKPLGSFCARKLAMRAVGEAYDRRAGHA